MDSVAKLDVPVAKAARYETDYLLCIICQQSGGILVEKPRSHDKVLQFVHERAKYGDGNYIEISRRFGDITGPDLASKNATWHRTCYQDTVNTTLTRRAEEKFEKQVETRSSRRGSSESCSSDSTFTRSQSVPFDKNVCFFCEQGELYNKSLHKLSTTGAGGALKDAVDKSGNDNFKVKLSTAIDPKDGHSIDIRYHKYCWGIHVTNVLRQADGQMRDDSSVVNEYAAEVEFLSLVQEELLRGHIFSMAILQEAYTNIRTENNLMNPSFSRKILKKLLQREIPDIEFHKSKRVNEPERVSIKKVRDAAIQCAEDQTEGDEDMKCLFSAASILRKAISKATPWTFTGSLTDIQQEHIPSELQTFYRWVIQGPRATLSCGGKTTAVNRNALSLAQTTMSMFLSKKQVSRKNTQSLRSVREMPQQLAIGLAIRQAFRSKKMVHILHGFGISVEYNRLLRIESQIANSVLQVMLENNSVYLPPGVIKGRYVFFAVDNVDFAEDTPDGKNTLHATAMAIYQRCQQGDEMRKLELSTMPTQRSLQELPDITMLECPKPGKQPASPIYPMFSLEDEQTEDAYLQDSAWLLGRTFCASSHQSPVIHQDHPEDPLPAEEHERCENIPNWSAYNSLINDVLPMTRIGTPPLLAAPAHEWSTLLTVLKQAQHINAQVIGPGHKTVISLDMGLYKPAKQLQMSRKDLEHIVLRPGELHVVMAQLRTLGDYIENSGLDFCWTEANIYGPATVKQILEGKHVRRGVEAHTTTLQALSLMYQESFLDQYPEIVDGLGKAAENLRKACYDNSGIQQANTDMIKMIQSLKILEKMHQFDKQNEGKPLFVVMRQYMQMVEQMLRFIRSVRTGDWNLHLIATKSFIKYFFAHSKLNYARMMPVYLADMDILKQTDADIYDEFLQGNWVVNKNPQIPFCAIGADHALEHINRSMKVAGGLVGITLNPNARTKFFLTAPELARLSGEAEEMAGYALNAKLSHHALSPSAERRQEVSITALNHTIRSFTNPFAQDSKELYNLVTMAVLPEKVTHDLCKQGIIGSQLFDEFVCKRIKTNELNIWAPMKKCQLQTWKSTAKKVKHKVDQKVVELKEDRNLFARLLIVAKSRPSINLEEAVGMYEFSVVPRSLFAADGEMLHCPAKSKLMSIITDLIEDHTSESVEEQDHNLEKETDMTEEGHYRVALVDGMAEVQALSKPDHIKTCSHLADFFCSHIQRKYQCMDEVCIIFDRYDIPHSLKQATRSKRQGMQTPVAYHITDTTNIAKLSMKQLLSHSQSKMELTGYLGQKLLEQASEEGPHVVVAWGTQCKATFTDKSYLNSDQEEADTKLLLHAADATACGATCIDICSPDTDVFILAICRYPDLCKNSYFVTGTKKNHQRIPLWQIYEALGPSRAAALPGLHALSGSDNTGSFAGKGKHTFWKAFQAASDVTISALASLGTTVGLSNNTCEAIEEFICKVYIPQTNISKVQQLRWWMFKKKQAESENLPPTPAALRLAILRSHYQAIVWNNDTVASPVIPTPDNYGWRNDGDGWTPIMTTELPAPQTVLHLVKCGCKTKCHSGRCSCRRAGLYCTELCFCSDEEQPCENVGNDEQEEADEDEEEE